MSTWVCGRPRPSRPTSGPRSMASSRPTRSFGGPTASAAVSACQKRRHGDFMTRRASLTFGFMLVALCLVAISVGSALLVMAHRMPTHTDERRADELARSYEQNYTTSSPERLEPIRRQITALRTPKWKLYDAGLDICLL